jgi:hypothetical protein
MNILRYSVSSKNINKSSALKNFLPGGQYADVFHRKPMNRSIFILQGDDDRPKHVQATELAQDG